MAAALLPVAGAAAARLGIGLAASHLIDKGINNAIPYAIRKAKRFTAKHKRTRGISKILGKVERGYDSKIGRIARTGASIAGGTLAFSASGKILKGLTEGAGAVGGRLGTMARGTQFFKNASKKGGLISRGTKYYNRLANTAGEKFGGAQSRLTKGITKLSKRINKPKKSALSQKISDYSSRLEQEIKNRNPPAPPPIPKKKFKFI